MSETPGRNDPAGKRDDEAHAGEGSLDARRDRLASLLATRRSKRNDRDGDGAARRSGYGLAAKVSGEFIAGPTVGAILGFGFDRYFDTSPWGLIVLLLLGFAAGVLNVLRAVGAVAERPKL